MSKNIIKEIKGIELTFKPMENKELWINATKLAKDAKKKLSHYWDSVETAEYCKELIEFSDNLKYPKFGELKSGNLNYPKIGELKSNSSESDEFKKILSFTKRGNGGGTYIHPELMIHFARWLSPKYAIVCDKAVKQIVEDGYFITEEAKANPSQSLIKEATSILTTRLGIDNTRDELIEYINQYLVDENWNTHSLPNALSSTYQHIHIATKGMIASQILEKEFKALDATNMVITNHRQKRKLPAIYSSDYLVAQNYYSEKEVTAFNKRLNFILSRVKTHIEFKPKQLSPQSVLALIKKASRDMVYETSNEIEGTTYKGKNAKQLRKALHGFVEGSVEFEEAMVLIEEIADGNTFTLGKS